MNIKQTASIFTYFIGSWHISRVLGKYGRAEGTAEFTLQKPGCLLYKEEVKFNETNSSQLHNCCQNYIYRYHNKKITKYFSDNKLFYELDFCPEINKFCGFHICLQDSYRATYDFCNKDNFILCYEVQGPVKDYTIITNFIRIFVN